MTASSICLSESPEIRHISHDFRMPHEGQDTASIMSYLLMTGSSPGRTLEVGAMSALRNLATFRDGFADADWRVGLMSPYSLHGREKEKETVGREREKGAHRISHTPLARCPELLGAGSA